MSLKYKLMNAPLSNLAEEDRWSRFSSLDILIFGDFDHESPYLRGFASTLSKELGINHIGLEHQVNSPVKEDGDEAILYKVFHPLVTLFHYDIVDQAIKHWGAVNSFASAVESLKRLVSDIGTRQPSGDELEEIANLTNVIKTHEVSKKDFRKDEDTHIEMAFNLVEKWEEITAKGEKKMAFMIGGAHLEVDDISIDKVLAEKMAEKGHQPKIGILNLVPIRDITQPIFAETQEAERVDGRRNLTLFVQDKEQGVSIHEFNVKGIDPSLIIPPPNPDIEAGKTAALNTTIRQSIS